MCDGGGGDRELQTDEHLPPSTVFFLLLGFGVSIDIFSMIMTLGSQNVFLVPDFVERRPGSVRWWPDRRWSVCGAAVRSAVAETPPDPARRDRRSCLFRAWVRYFKHWLPAANHPGFSNFMGPGNRFQGMNSASLCSLAGRYDNPIPPRCLAPIDCLLFKHSSSVRGVGFSMNPCSNVHGESLSRMTPRVNWYITEEYLQKMQIAEIQCWKNCLEKVDPGF